MNAARALMKTRHGTAATATLRPPGSPGGRPDAPKTSPQTFPGPLKDAQGVSKDLQGAPRDPQGPKNELNCSFTFRL